jgi:cytochrome c553
MTQISSLALPHGTRCATPGLSGRTPRLAVLLATFVALAACTDKAPPAGQTVTTSQTAPAAPVTQEQIQGTVHVCSSCHGLDGKSVSPTFPRLAGQRADYIEVQLKAFRDHTRADPHAHTYMWGMAAHLSDPLIQGLAAYFAALPPAAGTPGDPAAMAAGQKIFQDGIPDHEVPACQSCHGEHAEGLSTFPRLAGQHRDYLTAQLVNFASNARENEIMHQTSAHLSPEEIRAVTAYLAAQ